MWHFYYNSLILYFHSFKSSPDWRDLYCFTINWQLIATNSRLTLGWLVWVSRVLWCLMVKIFHDQWVTGDHWQSGGEELVCWSRLESHWHAARTKTDTHLATHEQHCWQWALTWSLDHWIATICNTGFAWKLIFELWWDNIIRSTLLKHSLLFAGFYD